MAKKKGYTAMDDPTPKRTTKSVGGPKVGGGLVGKARKKGGGDGKVKSVTTKAKKAGRKR